MLKLQSIARCARLTALITAVHLVIAAANNAVIPVDLAIVPFWIATGFAAFVLILTGRWGITGVILGTFLSHILGLSRFAEQPHSLSLCLLLTLTEAATAIGVALIARRFFSSDRLIGQHLGTALRFVATTALPPIVLGSTAATLTLGLYLPQSSQTQWLTLWCAWLAGDAIGLVTFLPLAVIVGQSQLARKRRNALLFGLPMLATVSIAATLFLQLRSMETQSLDRELNSLGERLKWLFESATQRKIDAIHAFRRAIQFYGAIDALTFDALADELFPSRDQIIAINLAFKVQGDGVKALKEHVIREGFPRFEIWRPVDAPPIDPAFPDSQTLLPITYVFPFLPNKDVQGLDLLGNPPSASAAHRALISGQPTATPTIPLAQGNSGVAVYYPITTHDAAADQATKLLNVVLDIDALFAAQWRAIGDPRARPALTDLGDLSDLGNLGDTQSHNRLLAIPTAPAAPKHARLSQNSAAQQAFFFADSIRFFDRTWQISVIGGPAWAGINGRVGSNATLAVAFLFIGLLGGYQVVHFHRGSIVNQLVSERTDELRKAKDAAVAAARVKNEFLAVTNHELRTPLNGIIATSELLLESELGNEQRHLATMIQSSGRILLDLINDVLDYAQMEAGKLNLVPTQFSPAQMLREWSHVFETAAKRKGLAFIVLSSGPMDTPLRGDLRRLNQIGINFLGNAIKFTDHGWVRLRVTVSPTEDNRSAKLSISIEDSGKGISERKLQRLFHAFEQDGDATTRRYEGSGLGLAICKQLSDAMHGTIEVQSQVDKGTHVLFSVSLPIAKAPDLPPKPTPATNPQLNPQRNILVVEDNPVNQRVMQLLLRRIGHHFIMVPDGKSALNALDNGPFDLLFLDIHLPDMDGLELARKIRCDARQWCQSVPIVALTANTTQSMHDNCLRAGMQDFVSKPVQILKIRNVIDQWTH